MNQQRTWAILRRLSAILAVTARSYGLSLQAVGAREPAPGGQRRREGRGRTGGKPATQG